MTLPFFYSGHESQLFFVARQQHVCETLCICQILWGHWTVFPFIFPHSIHVFSITDRQCSHSPCHLDQSSPPYPHVLLPGQLGSLGDWIHLLYHTQNVAELCEWGPRNLSGGLCYRCFSLHYLISVSAVFWQPWLLIAIWPYALHFIMQHEWVMECVSI